MRFCSMATQSVTPSGRPTNSAIVRRLYPSIAMLHPQQRTGLEVLRGPPEVDRALAQQTVVAAHHAGGETILAGIVVVPQIGEQPADLPACVAAEEVGELHGALGVRMVFVDQSAGVAERGRHREELHDDVDAAEEEALLPLHARLIGHDAVEAFARELATAALDEAHVRRQPPEVAKPERRDEPLEPERRIPAGGKTPDPRKGGQPLTHAVPP